MPVQTQGNGRPDGHAVVSRCGVALGDGKHVDGDEAEGLDRPEIGIFEAAQRITEAFGTAEEEFGLIKSLVVEALDDGVLLRVGLGGGHDETNGKGEEEQAEKVVARRERAVIAGIQLGEELVSVEYLNETAGLVEE